jgi:hypothetical protein
MAAIPAASCQRPPRGSQPRCHLVVNVRLVIDLEVMCEASQSQGPWFSAKNRSAVSITSRWNGDLFQSRMCNQTHGWHPTRHVRWKARNYIAASLRRSRKRTQPVIRGDVEGAGLSALIEALMSVSMQTILRCLRTVLESARARRQRDSEPKHKCRRIPYLCSEPL